MKTIELKVKNYKRGLNDQKSLFVVNYNNKECTVPAFKFQNREPLPDTITCVVTADRLKQTMQALYNKYYPEAKGAYIFKIKSRHATAKVYEVTDQRIDDDVKFKLNFSLSATDLKVGDTVRCDILGINDDKLQLRMLERNPSNIEFRTMSQLFDYERRPALGAWIENELLHKPWMTKVCDLHANCATRWVHVFAQQMEPTVYCLLSAQTDRASLLHDFCTAWLEAIEHSPFISELNDREQSEHKDHLTAAIEICEDFLDALQTQNAEQKIADCIATLNPRFYHYRIERRFRMMACVFSLDHQLLLRNIEPLLEMIKLRGEKRCCEHNVAAAISHILRLYVNLTASEVESTLSFDADSLATTRRCCTALCYLVRIMFHTEQAETPLLVSRLYQLIALANTLHDVKLEILQKAYASLFATRWPLLNYAWDELDSFVSTKQYSFATDKVSTDDHKTYSYTDGNTEMLMTTKAITLAPLNTPQQEITHFATDVFSVGLCYGKSLERLAQEADFRMVQTAWNDVEQSVFAPAKRIERKRTFIHEGDEVDVYITGLISDTTMSCRAVEHDIEGTMEFSSLFYYRRPKINLRHLNGSDGSPLIFPAIYKVVDGKVVFDVNDVKVMFAHDTLPVNEEVECFTVSVKNHSCMGITRDGYFINYMDQGEDIQYGDVARVDVTAIRANGNGEGTFNGFCDYGFDNEKAYANFAANFNKYCYDASEYTLAMARFEMEEPTSANADATPITPQHLKVVADIISKLSRLETDMRRRYGQLAICAMLSRLAHNEREAALSAARMKYVKMLFGMAMDTQLLENDVRQFETDMRPLSGEKEVQERLRVVSILNRFGRRPEGDGVDRTLMGYLTSTSSTLETRLARLVLSSHLLSHFGNRAINDQLLAELAETLGVRLLRKQTTHIGEESQTMEFKTSLVFPPQNGGRPDIDQQAANVARVVHAMMNSDGGTLYIGVNDNGDVVGLREDLIYFSEQNSVDDQKARDNFRNNFNFYMTKNITADAAAQLTADFEVIDGYYVFKVEIPMLKGFVPNTVIRVGTTVQKVN